MMMGVRGDTLQNSTRETITSLLNMASSLSEISNRVLLTTTMVRLAKKYDMPAISRGKNTLSNLDYDAFEQEVELAMYTAHFLFSKLNNPLVLERTGGAYGFARAMYIFVSFVQDALQFSLNNAIDIASNTYAIGAGGDDIYPIEKEIRLRKIKAAGIASIVHGLWVLIIGGVCATLPYKIASKLYEWITGRSLTQDLMVLMDKIRLPQKLILAIIDGWTNLIGISMRRSLEANFNQPAIWGLIENYKKGIKLSGQGKIKEAMKYFAPIALSSIVKASIYREKGARRQNGEFVEVPVMQQIMKAFSFSISTEAAIRYTDYDPLMQKFFVVRQNFAIKYALALLKNDKEEMEKIIDDIATYNKRMGYDEYKIDMTSQGFRRLVANEIKRQTGIAVRDINKKFRWRRAVRENILLPKR